MEGTDAALDTKAGGSREEDKLRGRGWGKGLHGAIQSNGCYMVEGEPLHKIVKKWEWKRGKRIEGARGVDAF